MLMPTNDGESRGAGSVGNWEDYNWPNWIPIEVRKQIEQFWDEKVGRCPEEWERDAITNGHPLGVQGKMNMLCEVGTVISRPGKCVHCWNNIARIITSEGRIQYTWGKLECPSASQQKAPNRPDKPRGSGG